MNTEGTFLINTITFSYLLSVVSYMIRLILYVVLSIEDFPSVFVSTVSVDNSVNLSWYRV